MSEDLVPSERTPTMERLEKLKKTTPKGVDYWLARDVGPVLGYGVWRDFTAVIDRAIASCEANGIEAQDHFVPTHRMMEVGKGAMREGDDYFVTRPACYLIAMNGDPSKPEVAASQAYFAVQTRRMEQEDQRAKDEKRLEAREAVSAAVKRVSGVAKVAGVRNNMQAVFHDARWQGLYQKSAADVKVAKGIGPNDNLFDRAGPLELSANEFQMNLAAEVIAKEGIKSETRAIQRNFTLAQDVRKLMVDAGAQPLEKIQLEPDTIKDVKKRMAPPKAKKVSGKKKDS